MKIRTDYVSNSSSSSFVVLGSQYTPKDGHRLTIEDFTELEDDEVFFAVFPNIGNGDYTFKLSPELMMDFDMREKPISIDMRKDEVIIYKIRKFRNDDYNTEFTYDASDWDTWRAVGEKVELESLPRKNDERLYCWDVDDHSPSEKEEIISWLEKRRKS